MFLRVRDWSNVAGILGGNEPAMRFVDSA
jgi:hypothetical protein